MRLQEQRSFKAINFDDADEYLAEGDVRDMSNVRVGYTESGKDGVVENVKGTTSLFSELGFTLPAGVNKCVFTCPDTQNNRLIWGNYNSLGNHAIYCYNVELNTISTILSASVLNFSGSIIHSVDILDNNLAWVDDNRPRSINITYGLDGVYGASPIEELITDAKVVPLLPPVCTTTTTFGDDYIKSLKSFQFIYRYVYKGGEKSTWSSVSKLVPTGYKDNKINKITLNVSSCELFTKTKLRNIVEYVEFASRELYTFNFNQFLRISTTELVAANGLVDYKDTESKTPLDTTETNTSFSQNPIKAGSVCFQNDRKFYADCTEGYDAFDLSPSMSGISTYYVPSSGGLPYLSDCDAHINDRFLKPDSEYSYAVEFKDKYGVKCGAITYPPLSIKTQEQLTNDYKANVLEFTLNLASAGSYPEWAETFEILRSDNKSVTFFVQGRVNKVLYCTGYDSNDDPQYINANASASSQNTTDSGAMELHIDISNWTQYGTNIGYTFTEGDRLTFLTLGGTNDPSGTEVFKGLKIKELRGSMLIVDYPQVGRANLNHAMIAHTQRVPSGSIINGVLSRFMVGDNGVALFSRIDRQVLSVFPPSDTPLEYPFPFTNVSTMPRFPFGTTNHLYGIGLNYTAFTDSAQEGMFVSSIDIFIVGSEGYFIRGNYDPSTDSFGNWNTANPGVATDLNSIEGSYFYHEKTNLIIVGDQGVILRYNIATGVFTRLTSGTTENLNYVYRSTTSNNIIIVGDSGTILRSADNGDSWTQINVDTCRNLNGLYYDGDYAIAVGDEGLVLVSNDGGATWFQQTIGTVNNLYSVSGDGSNDNIVTIGGEGGLVTRFSMQSLTYASYDIGSTKNVNYLISYYYGNGVEKQEKSIIVGDFDLLVDGDAHTDTWGDYSAYASAVFGSTLINHRAKIEIYSPKTTSGPVIYYETGDAYRVGQNYTFYKGKGDGDVFLIRKDFKGTDWYMPGDLIFSMTPDSFNTAGTWDKDFGRPNTVLLYQETQQRRNIIRFSDKYVQDSKINGLSNFQETNYESIPNEFGHIRKITPVETVLLINAERETATAYIDQTVFKQTNGEDVAATSDRVINNVRRLAGGFGCTHPESIVSYLGSVYWYASNKSASCRYNVANGVFPISEYKARTYFNNKNSSLINSQIVGGFEPKFRNYLATMHLLGPELVNNGDFVTSDSWQMFGNGWSISDGEAIHTGPGPGDLQQLIAIEAGVTYIVSFDITNYTNVSSNGAVVFLGGGSQGDPNTAVIVNNGSYVLRITTTADLSYLYIIFSVADSLRLDNVSVRKVLTPETIAFQEGTNRWISKYSFWPEQYGWINNEMYSFLNGEMWKHNSNSHRNKFHGRQYPMQIRTIFNKEPGVQKNFTYMTLDSGKLWSVPSMETQEGQETFILSGHFEKIQNEWWADVKMDINTPTLSNTDEALINGDFMQSATLNVLLENTASDSSDVKFITLYSNIINPGFFVPQNIK
jgi:photosystem II stability/assembly factor-like uncharacterized protein